MRISVVMRKDVRIQRRGKVRLVQPWSGGAAFLRYEALNPKLQACFCIPTNVLAAHIYLALLPAQSIATTPCRDVHVIIYLRNTTSDELISDLKSTTDEQLGRICPGDDISKR